MNNFNRKNSLRNRIYSVGGDSKWRCAQTTNRNKCSPATMSFSLSARIFHSANIWQGLIKNMRCSHARNSLLALVFMFAMLWFNKHSSVLAVIQTAFLISDHYRSYFTKSILWVFAFVFFAVATTIQFVCNFYFVIGFSLDFVIFTDTQCEFSPYRLHEFNGKLTNEKT